MLALVIFVGAAAKGLAGAAVDANAANMTAAQQAFANQATTTAQQANAQINAQINANLAAAGAGEVNTAGNAILYVGIGMIIAELPRVYYMCKLCGWVCCGGKTKDTAEDRAGVVMAINALIISCLLSLVLVVVIALAVGAPLSS